MATTARGITIPLEARAMEASTNSASWVKANRSILSILLRRDFPRPVPSFILFLLLVSSAGQYSERRYSYTASLFQLSSPVQQRGQAFALGHFACHLSSAVGLGLPSRCAFSLWSRTLTALCTSNSHSANSLHISTASPGSLLNLSQRPKSQLSYEPTKFLRHSSHPKQGASSSVPACMYKTSQ